MTKLNDTASDLWAQIFSRDASAPYATVIDPEYDEADEEPALREGLRDAGWNDQEIQSFVEAHLERKATAPTTSPRGESSC